MASAMVDPTQNKVCRRRSFFAELNEVRREMRIRELSSVVQKRFKFPENRVETYAEKVNNIGLCAIAQAESLRYKLLGGLVVRRKVSVSNGQHHELCKISCSILWTRLGLCLRLHPSQF